MVKVVDESGRVPGSPPDMFSFVGSSPWWTRKMYTFVPPVAESALQSARLFTVPLAAWALACRLTP
jgi:hypothetical protein